MLGLFQLYNKTIKKVMIDVEVRRRHCGGLSFAVVPPRPVSPPPVFFCLDKKAFVPELSGGLDMCKAL